MRRSMKSMVAMTMTLMVGVVSAQVPPELAEKLKSIGPVVNPASTAPLYAGRIVEKEPFAAVQIERDIAYGNSERNLLDVFKSTQRVDKGLPVLVFVHGGPSLPATGAPGPTVRSMTTSWCGPFETAWSGST